MMKIEKFALLKSRIFILLNLRTYPRVTGGNNTNQADDTYSNSQLVSPLEDRVGLVHISSRLWYLHRLADLSDLRLQL